MSNAVLAEGQQRAVLSYAQECNPSKQDVDEWYDNARRIVGGDDCCISLPISWFEKAIASGAQTVRLQMLAREIRML